MGVVQCLALTSKSRVTSRAERSDTALESHRVAPPLNVVILEVLEQGSGRFVFTSRDDHSSDGTIGIERPKFVEVADHLLERSALVLAFELDCHQRPAARL